MTCCFFGHSNCPFGIRPKIKSEVEKMMDEPGKVKFYVGNHGQFDGMVRGIMKELISEGKNVDYSVVLAYIRGKNTSLICRINTRIPFIRMDLRMFLRGLPYVNGTIG